MIEAQEVAAARAKVEAYKTAVLDVVRKAPRTYIEEWSDEVTTADQLLEAAEKELAALMVRAN